MNPAEWKKIKEIFNEAICIPEPQRINHVLNIQDEDPKIVEEVIKMLKADTIDNTVVDNIQDDILTFLQNIDYDQWHPEKLGPYSILDEAGRGGMGIVYKAHDPLLDRILAIKLLPVFSIHKDHAQSRLLEEAKAASKLEHPNIVTIYEVNTSEEGYLYIAMAYYEGETLLSLLKKGALTSGKLKKYLLQSMQALAAAHHAGITHCDVKPWNILITPQEQVKILDFGIARIKGDIEQKPSEAGTIPYMSPESLKGEGFSEASDVWSLGVTFFELFTGEKYNSASTREEALQFLQNPIPGSASRWKKLDPEVSEILKKCLHSDPKRRYQNVGEMLEHWEELQRRKTKLKAGKKIGIISVVLLLFAGWFFYNKKEVIEKEKIGVLVYPFQNMSSSEELDFISQGITEDIIALLSQSEHVNLASRLTYVNLGEDWSNLSRINNRLDAEYFLTGNLVEENNQLLVKVGWTSVKDEKIVWENEFQYSSAGMLTLQQSIINALTDIVRIKSTSIKELFVQQKKSNNPEAYSQYLRGRYHLHKRNRTGIANSINWFEKSLELDPGFALAWAGLSQSYIFEVWFAGTYPLESFPKAKESILRAIEMDSTLSEAYTTLALIHWQYDLDWKEAEKAFKKAIQLNPNNVIAYNWYGEFLSYNGKFQEGLTFLYHALSIDPLSLITMADMGLIYLFMGNYDNSLYYLQMALDTEPGFLMAKLFKAMTLSEIGEFEESTRLFESLNLPINNNPIWQCIAARNDIVFGNIKKAQNVLESFESRDNDLFISPVAQAFVFTALGNEDKALELLQKGIEYKDPMVIYIKTHTYFRTLRSNPKFQELVQSHF